VRIGVNWGSLDQELLARMMDEQRAARPAAGRQRRSCARRWCSLGLIERASAPRRSAWPRDRIVLSAKVSGVQDLIAVYRELGARAATTRCTWA
jgi:(E)-4-hydroxy-3-methylbut-2-enyl-diphosphate synthase